MCYMFAFNFPIRGHCHLEQPANAMSWLELQVTRFLQAIAASCVVVPEC